MLDSLLDAWNVLLDLSETDPLVFLLCGITAIAILLAILIAIIVRPLHTIHIDDDPMQHPFGNMPHLDRRSR